MLKDKFIFIANGVLGFFNLGTIIHPLDGALIASRDGDLEFLMPRIPLTDDLSPQSQYLLACFGRAHKEYEFKIEMLEWIEKERDDMERQIEEALDEFGRTIA